MSPAHPIVSPPVGVPRASEPRAPAFCEPSVRNWAIAVVIVLVVGSWSPLFLPESFPTDFIVLPGAVLFLLALFGLYRSIREDFFLSPERVSRYRRLFWFFGPLVAFVLLFQIVVLRSPVRKYVRSQTPAA